MNQLTEKMLEIISHMNVQPDFCKNEFSHLEEAYLDAMCKDEIFHIDLNKKWNVVEDVPCPTAQDMLNNGMKRNYKNKNK